MSNVGFHRYRPTITYTHAKNVFLCANTRHLLPLHCLHADWDRDPPSLPFKSHKTINLTSTDHPILLGPTDTNTTKSSLDFTSGISTETTLPPKETPAHPVFVSDPQPLRSDQFLFVHCSQSSAFLISRHPAMSYCRMVLQTELMEVSVRSL